MIISAVAKSLQSCPTLCDPVDGSPPGPAVPGIFQARVLEWVAIAFSVIISRSIHIVANGIISFCFYDWVEYIYTVLGHANSLQWCPTVCNPGTVALQAPQSLGFPRQEHWSGLLFLSPGDLPHPGTEHASLKSPALAGGFIPFFCLFIPL